MKKNRKNQTQNASASPLKGYALLLLGGAALGLTFILGFMGAMLINANESLGVEAPFSLSETADAAAPHDIVSDEKIHVYSDRIVIDVAGASLSQYASTGSMRPVFDAGANGIRIQPTSESQIEVGDIITFERDDMLIVHRVIEKGIDSEGTYFITKGDNNDSNDGKVRFSQVRYITIGVIY